MNFTIYLLRVIFQFQNNIFCSYTFMNCYTINITLAHFLFHNIKHNVFIWF